ncbi:MAG TPA: trehalose-phosphatase, partial [Terriglobia bacterium]|nr:trehalose-phosphatase [Terriglobia bacterium]
MQHLLRESLTEIRNRIEPASTVSLFLDFDGTLTPLIRNPEKVKLNTPTRNVLQDILGSRTIALHVISGRSLDDVVARVGLDGVTYAGN